MVDEKITEQQVLDKIEKKEEKIEDMKNEIKEMPETPEKKGLLQRIIDLESEVMDFKILLKNLRQGIQNEEREKEERKRLHNENMKKKVLF